MSSAEATGSRPAIRSRTHSNVIASTPPRSPRTPQLGRSVSSQFGSPSAFRSEPEEYVIYELGCRHLSVGFSGESRPRCILKFDPDQSRRVGDYRSFDVKNESRSRGSPQRSSRWGDGYELYQNDIRALELGLFEDKLERAVRTAHTDFLQLDPKSRKAVLAIPSLFPTPLLEIVLKIIFNHFSQPPSVTILTSPILACLGAGLRNALVIDIGWQETSITAVAEYKEIYQRRSIRAGKRLTKAVAEVLQQELDKQGRSELLGFAVVDEITERMAWCCSKTDNRQHSEPVALPLQDGSNLSIPFQRLAESTDAAFFSGLDDRSDADDHDLSIPRLAHSVLLSLSKDLRAACVSRIVITGGVSTIPGLKRRILQEIEVLFKQRGWDPVHNYGSAQAQRDRMLKERSSNATLRPSSSQTQTQSQTGSRPPSSKEGDAPIIPAHLRAHDDVNDSMSTKAERRNARKQESHDLSIRGVTTVGAWAGASLITSLKIKGVHEVEKEDFSKHGLRDLSGVVM